MRPAAAVALAALLAAAGCSNGDTVTHGASTTTVRLTPGYHYTDCSRIRAGDKLGAKAPGMLCDPAKGARLETIGCTGGVYVHLRRPPGGDLEGIAGRTDWREAGPVDARTGRTPFAFDECKEQ